MPPPLYYRAMIVRSSGPAGGTLLHIVGNTAAASLCGIVVERLGPGGLFDTVICQECIEAVRELGARAFQTEHPAALET